MNYSQLETVTLAQQGNPQAISLLLNQSLSPLGITTKVTRDKNRLVIFADAHNLPNRESLLDVVRQGIKSLDIQDLADVQLYGRKVDDFSTSWKEEIIFKSTNLNIDSRNKSNSSVPFIAFKKTVFNVLKLIGRFHLSRRVKIGLSSLILIAALTYAGFVGFQLWHIRSVQAQAIQKAQALISEISTNKVPSIDSLQESAKKLKESRDVLRGFSNSPGSIYQNVQSELVKVRSTLKEIEDRISQEESNSQNWQSADKAAQDTISSIQSPPYPLKTWKTTKNDLDNAIKQLQSIPENSVVSSQVKPRLASYLKQSIIVNQNTRSEEKAMLVLQQADVVANQAMAVTENKYDLSVSDLENSLKMWQSAHTQVKKVPPKSYAFQYVDSRLNIYLLNSKKIEFRMQELKKCLSNDRSGLSILCSSSSLDLQKLPSEEDITLNSSKSSEP